MKATRLNSFKVRLENFYAIYSGIFRTDLVCINTLHKGDNGNNNNNNNNNKLTIHGHHPKTDVAHLYVRGKQGGRGLMQIEAAHAVEITKIV